MTKTTQVKTTQAKYYKKLIKATYATAVLSTGLSIPWAYAADSTWNGTTSDYNTPTNWNPNVVPDGTAIFGANGVTDLLVSSPASIDSILFISGAAEYGITNDSAYSINGTGIVNQSPFIQSFVNSADATLTFNNNATVEAGAGIEFFNEGQILLNNMSQIGGSSVDITNAGMDAVGNGLTAPLSAGGTITFNDHSAADDATITNLGGSGSGIGVNGDNGSAIGGNATVTFNDSAHADRATIYNLSGSADSEGANGAVGGANGTGVGGSVSLTFNDDAHADLSTIETRSGSAVANSGTGARGSAIPGENGGNSLATSGNASTSFYDNAHADGSNFIIETGAVSAESDWSGAGGYPNVGTPGPGGDGGTATGSSGSAQVDFYDNTHADNSTFNLRAGVVTASGGNADGANASSSGNGGSATATGGDSIVRFNDNSHADNSLFNATGGMGSAEGGEGGTGGVWAVGGIGGNTTADGGGSKIVFSGNASAENSVFNLTGGASSATAGRGGHASGYGSGGLGGSAVATGGEAALTFTDNTNAANAIINNVGGDAVATGGTRGYSDPFSPWAVGGYAGDATAVGGNATVTFSGNAGAGTATITNTGGMASATNYGGAGGIATAVGGEAHTIFSNDSHADSAVITNNSGGTTIFHDSATADNAVILNQDGGLTQFEDTSNAGSALITNNSGALRFLDNAIATDATVVNNSGGVVDISQTETGVSIGSLSGSGDVFLGSKNLTVGALGIDEEIAGAIQDGGAIDETGGSLTKTGTGTLILSGLNTYTGNTNVNEGALHIGEGGNLSSTHIIVDGDATLEITGAAGNGVTNFGTTNVNTGGYVFDSEVGVDNREGAELNVFGDRRYTGVFGEIRSDEIGIRNAGVTNISGGNVEGGYAGVDNTGIVNVNEGGDIGGEFVGVVNGTPGGISGPLSYEEEHVDGQAVLNVNEGGYVSGGNVGVENNGVTNVNGGHIRGFGIGVINGDLGLRTLSREEGHDEAHAVLNINEGGRVEGEFIGVDNSGTVNVNAGGSVYGEEYGAINRSGVREVPQLGEDFIAPLSHDENGLNNQEPVINVNAGGRIDGLHVGVENSGTLYVNEGGAVSGGRIGLINYGEAQINGTVEAGTFAQVVGEAGVENYGYLTGAGTILSRLYNDGVLQPGAHDRGSENRYSTLSVDANADLTDGSTFITNIRDNQNSQLYVAGTADLAGDVEAHVDSFGLRQTYAIVDTGLGLVDRSEDGNFNEDVDVYTVDKDGNLNDASGVIVGELSYDDFVAYLTLTRESTDFSTGYGDLTRNQYALASFLDEFYNGEFPELSEGEQDEFLDRYNEFFANLFDGDVPQNLSEANGEGLTGLPVGSQAAARRFMERLLNQLHQQGAGSTLVAARKAPRLVYNGTRYASLLAQADAAPANAGVNETAQGSRSSLWATIGRASDNVDSDANNAGFDIRATEYQIGYTRALSPRTTLGLSIGKSDGRFDATDADTEGDTDTLSFGAALRHDSRDWYLTGGLAYNRHSIDSERRLGGFEYSGDTSGRTIELSGEVGKKIVSGQWRVEPNLTLNFANTRLDGYGEDGGPGALEIGSGKYNTRRVGIGVRIASNSASARFRPYFSAAYQREFGDRRVDLNNTLAGIGAFDVEGTELGRNIWKLRLGADARINDRLSVIGEIGGSWRDNNDSQYIFGGVKYGF